MADIEAKLALVHPTLAERVRKLIAMAAAEGFALTVTQGLRTFAEQDALFDQGRTKPGQKATNAKGGQSYHNYGLACDVAFVVDGKISWDDKLYNNIKRWAMAATLEWGGAWRQFADRPHVQLPSVPNWRTLLPIYKKGGLPAVWAEFK